jgi:aspartyl-tRNA(Asn)/glutamyl-tRNA(Gln) amidotransferase subunit C
MTNKTDSIDVRYVAHLARMHLSDAEAELFQGQLDEILDQVRTLSELDVEHVEPTAHAVPVHNVFREDRVSASLDHGEVMDNAPQARNGLFIVPKILE